MNYRNMKENFPTSKRENKVGVCILQLNIFMIYVMCEGGGNLEISIILIMKQLK